MEVVGAPSEMLSGRRLKDYATESAAATLGAQADKLSIDTIDDTVQPTSR